MKSLRYRTLIQTHTSEDVVLCIIHEHWWAFAISFELYALLLSILPLPPFNFQVALPKSCPFGHCVPDTSISEVCKLIVLVILVAGASIIKQSLFIILISCKNGATGFGPVPRGTIEVERKGQIRDWPKRASYLQEIRLRTPWWINGIITISSKILYSVLKF